HKIHDLTNEREHQIGGDKPWYEANHLLRINQQSWNYSGSAFGLLEQHFFHLVGIAVIADAHWNQQRHAALRQIVIGDNGLRHLGVGNNDQVVGQRAYGGAAPTDIRYVAFLARVELDVIPQADLSRNRHIETA